MQLKHAVDQVLHRAALLREGGEVTQVPLAGREVRWQVRRPHALVTGDDDLRVQRGDITSMLAIQASRFASSASYIIMCTLL